MTHRIAALLVPLLAMLPADAVAAKKPKPVPCAGRFVVTGDGLVTGSGDVIVVGPTVSIASGCPATKARRKATRKGTTVKAKWKACAGLTGKAVLAAKIDPTCRSLAGRFTAKKARVKRTVTGTLSSCGDGVHDAAMEACDGATGCAAGTCTADCVACQPGSGGGNSAPVAVVAPGGTVAAGAPLVLDGSASGDPDGDPLVHAWDFGDDGRGGGATIAHVWSAPGSYTVRLTVGDGRGGTDTAETTVLVTPGPADTGAVTVNGEVRDAGGAALAGVEVRVLATGATTSSDAEGDVSILVPRSVPVQLRLTRDGWADQTIVLTVPTASAAGWFQAVMLPREDAQALDAATGGTLVGTDGATIVLPPNALVDGDGAPVTGPVEIAMTPLDVLAKAAAFPGRFEGIDSTGTTDLLLSWGTVEYVLTAGGEPVQLAPGTAATIEIPSYAGLRPDGSSLAAGDTIPLWSLDERTGTWIQEGTGTLVAAPGSPTGFALRGSVTHFSWWNCDKFPNGRYGPRPKCLVDSNADGILEDLTGTGHCWNAGTGPEQPPPFGFAADPLRGPTFFAATLVPAAGGVELPIPADMDLVWHASADDGLLVATKILRNGVELPDMIVSGPAGASDEIIVVLEPLDAGTAVPITVPHQGDYVIDPAGEVDQYAFTTTAGTPIAVQVARLGGSFLTGTVRVTGPGGFDLGPAAVSSTAGTLAGLAPADGAYRVIVTGSAGGYDLVVDDGSSIPVLVSTTPADLATGVALGQPVVITFSADIDPPTVNSGSVRLTGFAGQMQVDYAVVGPTVTVTPTQGGLWSGNAYTLLLSPFPAPVKSTAGYALKGEHAVTFRTVDAPAAPAAIGSVVDDVVAVAAHADDSAVVHWRVGYSGGGLPFLALMESRYEPGTGWLPPVNRGPSGATPYLAANGMGEVLEVLRVGGDLRARRQVGGAAWSALVDVEQLASTHASDSPGVGLALDDLGTGWAAWIEDDTTRALASRWPSGGSWEAPVELAASVTVDPNGNAARPDVAVNATGHAVAGWAEHGDGKIRRYEPGSGWQAAEDIEDIDGDVTIVRVGIDAGGNVMVLSLRDGMFVARRRVAMTGLWADEVPLGTNTVDTIGRILDTYLKLAVAPDGSAVAAGVQVDGGPVYTWARHFTPDASSTNWEAPVTIGTNLGSATVGLGMDAAGNAFAASRANAATGMVYRKYTAGVGWDMASGSVPYFADYLNEHWTLTMGAGGMGLAIAVDENPPGVSSIVGDLFAARLE